MNLEDEYLDVLQNIEAAIVISFENKLEIIDYDVMDAIKALIQVYRYEEKGFDKPPKINLTELSEPIFQAVKQVCDTRLGRNNELPILEPITIEVVIACLRKIEKSIEKWSKRFGKRGYLNFVKDYVK